jgi:hypothetical protein
MLNYNDKKKKKTRNLKFFFKKRIVRFVDRDSGKPSLQVDKGDLLVTV